jgi:hypothetical protein
MHHTDNDNNNLVNGHIEVFVRSGELCHTSQTGDSNPWSSWTSLDGNLACPPFIARNGKKRLDFCTWNRQGSGTHTPN